MPFTAQELENAANAAIEYHYKVPEVLSQTIQDKPLLAKMTSSAKTFPGGRDAITFRVKGDYTTTVQGFTADDEVSYANPANIKQGTIPWYLLHWGISFTMHEMLKNGITISDTTTGESSSKASKAEKIMLANLMNDKVEDMKEGSDRDLNTMYWRDGTIDPEKVPGVTYWVVDNPSASAVIGGLSSTYPWWRNRASLSINLGAGPETGAVLNTLQYELRQLRRYGGQKQPMWLAGSDMMDRIEKELKAQGYYTDSGWAKSGRIDGSVADLAFKGIAIDYDPTLDDLGYAKRLYALDCATMYPMVIDGENGKDHTPARPENKYVFYKAKTWVGGLICRQRNGQGVYGFA